MKIIKITPNAIWGWDTLSIKLDGKITYITPMAGSFRHSIKRSLNDNCIFTANVRFVRATGGTSANLEFKDTDPNEPYNYIMSGQELGDFFTGLEAGKITCQGGVFSGTFTWVKRGTSLFIKPII